MRVVLQQIFLSFILILVIKIRLISTLRWVQFVFIKIILKLFYKSILITNLVLVNILTFYNDLVGKILEQSLIHYYNPLLNSLKKTAVKNRT